MDATNAVEDLTDYHAHWEPRGYSVEGYHALSVILPAPYRGAESTGIVWKRKPAGSNVEARIDAAAVLISPVGIRAQEDQPVNLTAEEADRWYDVVNAPDVVALGHIVSAMLWYEITVEDAVRFRETLQLSDKRSLQASAVYLWRRLPSEFSLSDPTPSQLAKSAMAVVNRVAEERGVSDPGFWMSRYIALSDVYLYRELGLDTSTIEAWDSHDWDDDVVPSVLLRSMLSQRPEDERDASEFVAEYLNRNSDAA